MKLKSPVFGTLFRFGVVYLSLLSLLNRLVILAVSGSAHFSWPNGRIPYLDDLALTADPDQAVALNNARMDLQVRSCVRFYPRRLEKDFVFFTDLGPQVECWNMFDHTKGRVEVNAGPSCLEPMRRPHRPRRVFSDCDIEYVNHLYNCPRRRFVSPICPAGQNIMARPPTITTVTTTTTESTTTTTTPETTTSTTITTTTTVPTTITTMTTNSIGPLEITAIVASTGSNTHNEEEGEEFTEDELVAYSPTTVEATTTPMADYVDETLASFAITPEPTAVPTNEQELEGEEGSETGEDSERNAGYVNEEWGEYRHHSSKNKGLGNKRKGNSIGLAAMILTTPHPDWHSRGGDSRGSDGGGGGNAGEEEYGVVDEMSTTEESTVVVEDQLTSAATDASTATEQTAAAATMMTDIPQTPFPTLIQTSEFLPTTFAEMTANNIPFSPPPLPSTPLMMTLITTPSTTTTTFAPPPPDWVRSVEASFENRQNSGLDGSDAAANVGEAGAAAAVESASGRAPSNVAVEIIDYAGSGAGAMGIGNNIIAVGGAAGGPAGYGGSSNAAANGGYSGNIIDKNNNNNINGLVVENGDKNSPGYSVSQTKIITTIEKSNYAGPCGSACAYSGDLVKLYRSYNDKTEMTDHFYTTDRLEHHLMASQGYTMQPHMGHLGRNHIDPLCSCLKPLYRLYNDFMKDHLLTSTEQEKDMAERILGYKFERVLGFCTKEPGCGAYVPLYRFYNPIAKDHLYTTDQQEMHYYKTHPEQAYGFENIECYVWQHNSSTKGCPALMLAGGGRLPASAEDFARL